MVELWFKSYSFCRKLWRGHWPLLGHEPVVQPAECLIILHYVTHVDMVLGILYDTFNFPNNHRINIVIPILSPGFKCGSSHINFLLLILHCTVLSPNNVYQGHALGIWDDTGNELDVIHRRRQQKQEKDLKIGPCTKQIEIFFEKMNYLSREDGVQRLF